MKACVILSLLIAVAVAELTKEFKDDMLKEIQEIGAECAKKENANEDDIKELLGHKIPTRKEGKCLLACINEKYDVQDKDGKLNLDGAIKSLEPFKEADMDIYNKFKQVLEMCMTDVEDTGDRCETAAKLSECGEKHAAELGIPEDVF